MITNEKSADPFSRGLSQSHEEMINSTQRRKIAVIPLAIAGSGKSLLYKEMYSKFTRISADLIREEILPPGVHFDQEKEPEVKLKFFKNLEDAIARKEDIYIDRCNTTYVEREWLYLKIPPEYDIYLIVFRISISQIFKQNRERERFVREAYIREQLLTINPPSDVEKKKTTVIEFWNVPEESPTLHLDFALDVNDLMEKNRNWRVQAFEINWDSSLEDDKTQVFESKGEAELYDTKMSKAGYVTTLQEI